MLGAVGGGSSAPLLRACQQQKLTQRPGALRQLQDPGSLQSGQFQGASLEDLDHLTPGKQEGHGHPRASSAKTRGFHTQLDEGPETP